MSPRKRDKPARELSPEQTATAAMVTEAKTRGLASTGPNGLLKQFTKTAPETALHDEMTEHLGHEKTQAESGRESEWHAISDAAADVEITVPRDRDSTLEPQIVKKRQRRLSGESSPLPLPSPPLLETVFYPSEIAQILLRRAPIEGMP